MDEKILKVLGVTDEKKILKIPEIFIDPDTGKPFLEVRCYDSDSRKFIGSYQTKEWPKDVE